MVRTPDRHEALLRALSPDHKEAVTGLGGAAGKRDGLGNAQPRGVKELQHGAVANFQRQVEIAGNCRANEIQVARKRRVVRGRFGKKGQQFFGGRVRSRGSRVRWRA